MMKRYKQSLLLILLNIVFEYVLILITYFICALVRVHITTGARKTYNYGTITKFVPFIVVVDLFIVIVFFVLGDYISLHFRNKKRIIVGTFLVILVAGAFGSSVLFFIDGSQFSRLLLIMVVIVWTLVISCKRLLFESIANKMMSDKIKTLNVLILGNGDNAKRYYSSLVNDSSTRYTFKGYLAKAEASDISGYLGTYERLREVIEGNAIGKVVIADEEPSKEFLDDVLYICSVLGIEVIIIPVYADYIADKQRVWTENGIHYLNVNAFNHSNILGVNIAVTDMDKTISDIYNNLEKWRGKYICVSNVHTTVMAHDDEAYRKVQNEAVLALPDGGPLSSYSRSEGKSEARRVTGPDLMRELLSRSGEHASRHFFYGSSQKTLDMLREKIEKDYPGAIIAGMISPPYRELSSEEDSRFIEEINEARPDFIWVGLGAPKQEIWMAAHKDKVCGLMVGVGAAFDYESGNLKRAPKWMQKCNLEWFYRFAQEPRRLFKRYFVTNIKFLWLTRR